LNNGLLAVGLEQLATTWMRLVFGMCAWPQLGKSNWYKVPRNMIATILVVDIDAVQGRLWPDFNFSGLCRTA
jgi:hypothetical protein